MTNAIDFQIKSRVTLRGAGPGQTILDPRGSTAITSGQSGLSSARPIISGSTKGSTRDHRLGRERYRASGTMLDIFQANDPDFYWSRGNSTDRTGQYAMVTAVQGNTLSSKTRWSGTSRETRASSTTRPAG